MENKEDTIDIGKLIRKVWSRRKVFYKAVPAVFVLACLLIICVPRYYSSSISLAPEMSSGISTEGALGSIASSMGFDLSGMTAGADAISPLLYPDLMSDNGFIARLLSIRVKSADGEIDTTYYHYLDKCQKKPWWGYVGGAIRKLLPKPKDVFVAGSEAGEKSPYIISRREEGLMEKVRKNITLSVDKKTGVITIKTQAQDPLIAKTLADSATVKLQDFITAYRTNKARVDLEYYRQVTAEAREKYDEARREYSRFTDQNNDIVLEEYRSIQSDLDNEMQLAFNTYSLLNTQLQSAVAKVQEDTPAFTMLKGAEMQTKPAGPKRMLFVIGMCILACIACVVYILKDDLRNSLLKGEE